MSQKVDSKHQGKPIEFLIFNQSRSDSLKKQGVRIVKTVLQIFSKTFQKLEAEQRVFRVKVDLNCDWMSLPSRLLWFLCIKQCLVISMTHKPQNLIYLQMI